MSDLSPYIAFSVVLNKAATTLKFLDTGAYPAGAALTFAGYFTIVEPDGVLVQVGTFASPSIFWSSGSLTQPTAALRLNTANTFMSGNYTVVYYLRATGYTDTILTKSFNLIYNAPTQVLTPNFDLFTPGLSVTDATTYDQGGLTVAANTRTWAATIISVLGTPQNITGNGTIFDMNYMGSYYDSQYNVTLTAVITYVLGAPYAWVTLIDTLAITATYYAQVPPTIAAMDVSMTGLKNTLDASTNDCNTYPAALANYLLATSLYADYRRRGCDGEPAGLETNLYQLLKIFNNNVNPVYVNTNAAIGAYNWQCGDFTTTVPWSAITGKPSSITIEWVVGAGGFPAAGATTMTDARLVNISTAQIVLFRNGQPQFAFNPGDGNTYYTKASAAVATIIFSVALGLGEEMKVVLIGL